MKLQDLFGIYYVYDYRTRSYGQEYMLEIMAATKDKIEFIFQTTASGNFGSSGIIWKPFLSNGEPPSLIQNFSSPIQKNISKNSLHLNMVR